MKYYKKEQIIIIKSKQKLRKDKKFMKKRIERKWKKSIQNYVRKKGNVLKQD